MREDLDAFARSLGVTVTSTDPVVLSLTVAERHHNFYDTTHGGAVFSIADAALGLAAGPRAFPIDSYLTLTAASTAGDTLTARAEEVTRGRTLATYLVTVTRSDGRVTATLSATVRMSG
jgi:uncharacterized protein (TIGR00369 family)